MHPPDEVDVFHDREIGKTSDGLEPFPPDEQRLVAVREAEERDAQPNAELDDAGERGRASPARSGNIPRRTIALRSASSIAARQPPGSRLSA